MSENPPSRELQVAREGAVIGLWPAEEIRRRFLNGELRATDYFYREDLNKWLPLMPAAPYPQEFPPFAFTGDAKAFYYLQGGSLFGPRTLEEIAALVYGGMLMESDIITCIGAEKWYRISEFFGEGVVPKQASSNLQSHIGRAIHVAATFYAFGPEAAVAELFTDDV